MMGAVILGSLEIPAVPDQVAPARHWLSALLAGGHDAIADDIVLMACEAVTNSICHSDSGVPGAGGEPGTVTLVVLDAGDALRIEVTDAGSADSVPQVADDALDALHGRGLHLLDVLSAGRWGSYADGDGPHGLVRSRHRQAGVKSGRLKGACTSATYVARALHS